jgi:Amt family ammonium transporter
MAVDHALVVARDHHWATGTSTASIILVLAGLMLVRAGLSRSKNAASTAQACLSDLIVGGTAFCLFGFAIMYGYSPFLLGNGSDISASMPSANGLLVTQLLFCAIVIGVISGATAKRMRYPAYLAICVVAAVIVYPVFNHWLYGNGLAWLDRVGFVDPAGATSVHAIGGWMALAGIGTLGRREAQLVSVEGDRPIECHSPTLAAFGCLLAVVGWVGLIGGSGSYAGLESGLVESVVVMAALGGGMMGMAASGWHHAAVRPDISIMGTIAGLVVISAFPHFVMPEQAFIMGATGALVANLAHRFITLRCGLDDVTGAVSVHACASVVGTLALPLFAPEDMLYAGSRTDQFVAQLVGVATAFVWAFGGGWMAFVGIDRLIGLRVNPKDDHSGLAASERSMDGDSADIRAKLLDAAKLEKPLRLAADLAPNASEEAGKIIDALQDIIEDGRKAESQRRLSEARFRDFAISTADIFWETNERHELVFVSSRFTELVGTDQDELLGRPLLELIEPLDGENNFDLASLFARCDPIRKMECAVHSRADSEKATNGRILRVSANPLHDMNGTFQGYRGTATEITDELAKQQEIAHMALHDDLTDLANRNSFYRELQATLDLQKNTGELIAVFAIDLDGFKDINDTFGHDAGDALLIAVAERIRGTVRSSDIAARLGGDEFAAILRGADTNLTTLRNLSRNLVRTICEPVVFGGQEFRVSCSIGIACAPEDGATGEELVKSADLALCEAKNGGKNKIQRVNEALRVARTERKQLEQDLRSAIKANAIQVVFQPKINLKSHTIIGAEALARWHHPERGWVAPDVFVPIAEEIGLVLPLGNTVLRQACSQARSWPDGPDGPVSVAVNISPAQLVHQDLPTIVRAVFEETGMSGDRLEFEITEHMLMKSECRTVGALHRLADMDIKLSIDDFGTGHSSLAYLKQFPLDQLKIDKSFIKDITEDESDLKIVQAIIQLAHGLDLAIVAEGVETEEQAKLLEAMGCQTAQGYLYYRPMSPSEFIDLLKARALPAPEMA